MILRLLEIKRIVKIIFNSNRYSKIKKKDKTKILIFYLKIKKFINHISKFIEKKNNLVFKENKTRILT
jgi:hemerythrin-like domain-containing protein